jgi:hypothetical protein
MRAILYLLREMVTPDNVHHFPYPLGDGQWRTYDLCKFNSYISAVEWSKKHNLPRVTVQSWNETTQKDVYSKTYW